MAKTDFADAYKHVTVCEQDTDLQWFQWAGKFFKELCLIFGSASSAGIFDDLAKVMLDLVCRGANFPTNMVCQHLDDICAADIDRDRLEKFDNTFKEFASFVGIKLAPRDNPDKSFAPAQTGTIFGICYDTDQWTWGIPDDRLAKLVRSIDTAVACGAITAKEMQSLAGKLINVKPLMPAAKFNLHHIMRALADSHNIPIVELSVGCVRQLLTWKVLLQAVDGKLSIPNPLEPLPAWSLKAYTDAAGGTLESPGRGTGGVCGQFWYYYPWSPAINSGSARSDGKKISRKLSALERIGPLILVASMPEQFRLQPVQMLVDNAGSVEIWRKGYSNNCPLSSTIVRAIGHICAGIGCRLEIRKITRCSAPGPLMADYLSKAQFGEFRRCAEAARWPLNTEALRIPPALLYWLHSPTHDWDLGHRILADMASFTPVLGYSVV